MVGRKDTHASARVSFAVSRRRPAVTARAFARDFALLLLLGAAVGVVAGAAFGLATLWNAR